jgi:class 3 adenylate cyclase
MIHGKAKHADVRLFSEIKRFHTDGLLKNTFIELLFKTFTAIMAHIGGNYEKVI